MKRYKIALKSDTGLRYVSTYAENEERAKEIVCAAENAPLRAVKWSRQILPKIKTLDIVALEWFDRVNGNSYFSGSVTVNFGLPDSFIIWIPYQYGYGDTYKHEAFKALMELGYEKKYKTEARFSHWQFCQDNKIIVRYTKHENCKRAELANIADTRKR